MSAERCSLLFLLNFLCDCFYWLSRFRGVVVCIKPQLKLFLLSSWSLPSLLLVLTTCSSSSIEFFPEWRRTCFLFHWLFQQRKFLPYLEKEKWFRAWNACKLNWIEWRQEWRLVACENDIFHRKANLEFLTILCRYSLCLASLHIIDLLKNQLDVHRSVDSGDSLHTCYSRVRPNGI